MAVIASLVMGSNGATSIEGSSRGLSTPPDRERFLARHRSASAFIIGRESAARERYLSEDTPIFVFTRNTTPLHFENPAMQQINSSLGLQELVRLIDSRIEGQIVIEAGPTLLTALVAESCVDRLELSITPIEGDGNFLDCEELLQNFEIEKELTIDGTRLLECRYKGNATHS